MRDEIIQALLKFRDALNVKTKGNLSVALTLTYIFSEKQLPLNASDFVTENSGQVSGLGGSVIKTILNKHNINQKFASEGGRTSRGSMGLMRRYVDVINELKPSKTEFEEIEKWWVERVKEYFTAKPYKLDIDPSLSIKAVLYKLVELSNKKQRENPGTKYTGALYQHLVAAKLSIALKMPNLETNGYSVNDEQSRRSGDFHVGDSCIHVTTAPTQDLINKCLNNIQSGLRPIIITSKDGCEGAEYLIKTLGCGQVIEVIELEQFIATNLYEWASFSSSNRKEKVCELVTSYNFYIEKHEGDPSMKIELI